MNVVAQKMLMETYRAHAEQGLSAPDWKSCGFRCYSQHEEDGYILYLFSLLGFTNRRVVEICCGSGDESNTANLILNHRCTGLLFEGDEALAKHAEAFYKENQDSKFWPPKIFNGWVTADNINFFIERAGFGGEIDLLSIDIDGIDYWLWKAISVLSPRVVVTEINHLWGPEESVTVPYADDFKAVFTQYGSDYAGASIAAFNKLAKTKGYRLVGANAFATNVFFVRNDLAHPWLPEVAPKTLFWHPRAEFGRNVRFQGIKDKAWERV
ncbi:MAG: hypothetical protein PHS57_06495 [Alphaproteobacteria bacterium]|nr:hypothetical protein [Alphaproteobacteria bacterium]